MHLSNVDLHENQRLVLKTGENLFQCNTFDAETLFVIFDLMRLRIWSRLKKN